MSCMDTTSTELENNWKTYAQLTVAQGQTRLCPAIKKNICALDQWVKDKVRTGVDPSTQIFTITGGNITTFL